MKKVSVPNWAEEVKSLRLARDLSQDKLAAVLDIASSTIGFWETGKVMPSKVTMAGVKALLSKSVNLRYSEQTRQQLHEAVDLILDNAPSAIVGEAIDFLSERAVKYRELHEAFHSPGRSELHAVRKKTKKKRGLIIR